MLYNLLVPLADDFQLFNLFRYLTFRTGGAIMTAMLISFVIGRDGLVLDETELLEAMRKIDDGVAIAPLGYMVNCVHPSFIGAADQPPELFKRLVGIQANAS